MFIATFKPSIIHAMRFAYYAYYSWKSVDGMCVKKRIMPKRKYGQARVSGGKKNKSSKVRENSTPSHVSHLS